MLAGSGRPSTQDTATLPERFGAAMRPPGAFVFIDLGADGVPGVERPWPHSAFAGIGLQQRYIHEILRAPRRALVREEVGSAQIGN